MNANRAAAAMLSFDELQRCRDVFDRQTDEYVTHPFELKMVLSQLGQYPAEEELHAVMRIHGGKMSFNVFCKYMEYLKYKFISPEPTDMDTIRAFAALGGEMDRTGCVEANYLRDTCKHFDLGIDIDKMLHEVDSDGSGAISFDEFKAMWDHSILEDDGAGDALEHLRRASEQQNADHQHDQQHIRRASFYDDGKSDDRLVNRLRAYFFPDVVAREQRAEREAAMARELEAASSSLHMQRVRSNTRKMTTFDAQAISEHQHQQATSDPTPTTGMSVSMVGASDSVVSLKASSNNNNNSRANSHATMKTRSGSRGR
eukprot:PhM_4_TR9786/c0_g1_i8/m.40482